MRWEGDGELAFPGLDARVVARGPHRIVLDVQDTRGAMQVAIVRTNPADPVRDVRFLWPGTEAAQPTQPFNPLFLERLAPFSTLRFMDWGATNGSPVARWADRARVEERHWTTERGVPLEVMLDLANTLQADPWLCIPHLADDDYVRHFVDAGQGAARPAPEGDDRVLERGLERRLRADALGAGRVGAARPAGAVRLSLGPSMPSASTRIAAICAEVFGPSQRDRWAAVVAGQAAWTNFAKEALAWKDTAAKVDALAIAPYFQAAGGGRSEAGRAHPRRWTADAIIDQMLASIRGEVKSRLNDERGAGAAATGSRSSATRAGPTTAAATSRPTGRSRWRRCLPPRTGSRGCALSTASISKPGSPPAAAC